MKIHIASAPATGDIDPPLAVTRAPLAEGHAIAVLMRTDAIPA